MRKAYTNCNIFTGAGRLTGKAILVNNNIIEDISDEKNIDRSLQQEDLEGLNIAPAFIDLQIYGGNGKLFSAELNVEALQATYKYCLGGGCTQFMITIATNTIDVFLKGIEAVKAYWSQGGKGLLGLHLEGPYLNPEKRGAHIYEYIKTPAMEEVKMLLNKGRGVIKMITVAPEMCSEEIITYLMEQDIIVSVGHSNATYHEAMQKISLGIPAATHLFNAMSAFQSRQPGMVGAVYNSNVKSSIVADGIHVDFVALSISKRLMGDRLFFITDAVTEASVGGYQHVFKGDRYTLPNGTLSGSALTMMQAVKNAVAFADIPREEALRMASTYPAQLLNEKKQFGRIEKNYAADFVVFDDALNIKRVIC
ncbi:MAG: N-acetylglucosamine-6-phosphate deacetylase [Chitinophagaceae bacterium]|nr:N-acetylglucosamine-6-phosphate deacetylase [Chitinophagaceae bacterium]